MTVTIVRQRFYIIKFIKRMFLYVKSYIYKLNEKSYRIIILQRDKVNAWLRLHNNTIF